MNTILLRLVGPMQSWGVQSRFGVRDTGLEPSKSGVIGLVCAALGVAREDDEKLASLAVTRMGVRVDREGRLSRDYHTALRVVKAGGGIKDTELSTRYYLADAAFLTGLESENLALLETIDAALKNPAWPLFLGRKAFVSGQPVHLSDGLKPNCDLLQALQGYPFIGRGDPPDKVRLVIEDLQGELVRPDQPVSFKKDQRKFAPRRLRLDFIPMPRTEMP
jgi:CRISPR system Cascade subunit CasD